ncbi:hypothetical protein PspLS_08035 [Pyricularia sp. CBS 133598]|nr:hypothetical protein PspLS_08035 [Pyricularia sp. CBS 133598]
MGEANSQSTLLDLNFLRPGSLSLTSRRIEEEPAWQDSEVKTIELSLGLCSQPMTFRVRRFVPGQNDALSRTWVDPDGRPRSTPLAPYAVADIPEAVLHIQQYIRDNNNCFVEAVRQRHPAVQLVYSCVPGQLSELRALNESTDAGSTNNQVNLRQLKFLEQYSHLWFGIRNTVGSSWLCGSETLGMLPIHEEGYPLEGKISTPRQVVQTVGCLLDHVRFSLPTYVVGLHESAHCLVTHWLAHAAKAGVDFSSKHKLESSLDFLAESKRQAIVQSYAMVIDEACPVVRASPETWTQDLCFVSHMFGAPWEKDAMYTGN